jgi:hypothetical protein
MKPQSQPLHPPPQGLTERRNGEVNRRANGWRWMAKRAERRRGYDTPLHDGPHLVRVISGRFGGRRVRHRRREDREADD